MTSKFARSISAKTLSCAARSDLDLRTDVTRDCVRADAGILAARGKIQAVDRPRDGLGKSGRHGRIQGHQGFGRCVDKPRGNAQKEIQETSATCSVKVNVYVSIRRLASNF